MKMSIRLLIPCAMLAIVCVIGLSCVKVDAPQETGSSDVVALGGSNGYVLLLHPNGKFYSVELQTRTVTEVVHLPAVSKPVR